MEANSITAAGKAARWRKSWSGEAGSWTVAAETRTLQIAAGAAPLEKRAVETATATVHSAAETVHAVTWAIPVAAETDHPPAETVRSATATAHSAAGTVQVSAHTVPVAAPTARSRPAMALDSVGSV